MLDQLAEGWRGVVVLARSERRPAYESTISLRRRQSASLHQQNLTVELVRVQTYLMLDGIFKVDAVVLDGNHLGVQALHFSPELCQPAAAEPSAIRARHSARTAQLGQMQRCCLIMLVMQ